MVGGESHDRTKGHVLAQPSADCVACWMTEKVFSWKTRSGVEMRSSVTPPVTHSRIRPSEWRSAFGCRVISSSVAIQSACSSAPVMVARDCCAPAAVGSIGANGSWGEFNVVPGRGDVSCSQSLSLSFAALARLALAAALAFFLARVASWGCCSLHSALVWLLSG